MLQQPSQGTPQVTNAIDEFYRVSEHFCGAMKNVLKHLSIETIDQLKKDYSEVVGPLNEAQQKIMDKEFDLLKKNVLSCENLSKSPLEKVEINSSRPLSYTDQAEQLFSQLDKHSFDYHLRSLKHNILVQSNFQTVLDKVLSKVADVNPLYKDLLKWTKSKDDFGLGLQAKMILPVQRLSLMPLTLQAVINKLKKEEQLKVEQEVRVNAESSSERSQHVSREQKLIESFEKKLIAIQKQAELANQSIQSSENKKTKAIKKTGLHIKIKKNIKRLSAQSKQLSHATISKSVKKIEKTVSHLLENLNSPQKRRDFLLKIKDYAKKKSKVDTLFSSKKIKKTAPSEQTWFRRSPGRR